MTATFGDLPPERLPRRNTTNWTAISNELRSRPNEWAKVSSSPTPKTALRVAWQVRHGHYSGLTAGDFEAVARDLDVWARYVGGVS